MTMVEYVMSQSEYDKDQIIELYCPNDYDLPVDNDLCDYTKCEECWNREHKTIDLVRHPAHYCYSEYEPKDVIRAWGLNFNLGSAVKYIARAGRKDDIIQELNKAKQFIEFELEALEKERNK